MASSEAEDEELKRAIAMSLAQDNHGPGDPSISFEPGSAEMSPLVDGNVPQPNTSSTFAGLDRKAMEEARLARLARKRERSISPPPARSPNKAPKLEATTTSLPSGAKLTSFSSKVEANTIPLPSGARLTSFSTLVQQDQQGRKSDAAISATEQLKRPNASSAVKPEPQDDEQTESTNPPLTLLRCPNGIVKKTWAFGFDRTGDDVKLEEVLEPLTLRTAVLSAFQWNTDWVLSKLRTPPSGGTTKCVFVMQAKEESLRQQMIKETEDMRPFLRLCFPPMTGQVYCMHSKLMLLFHPHKLRIAIPTANLLDFDWGETGVMENSVFMIDLPRLPEGGKGQLFELTLFGKELLYFLEQKGLDEDVRSGVLNFDFTATQDMRFVHTVGGILYGEDAQRTGLPGLARAVRQLNLRTGEGLQIDFAASSIGSLNDDQLRNMHAAARGEDMIARANEATSKAKADFFKSCAMKSPSEGMSIRDRMRVYFPTHETVKSSIAHAAGTICLSRKWWEAGTFPRSCFRDYRSTRTGLLSHNKILYARGKQQGPDGSDVDVAWAYVGSANMSESAWGKLVDDNKKKTWKINCRNWECGVLLPVPRERLAVPSSATPKPVKKEKIEGEDSETESEDEGGTAAATKRKNDIVGMDVFEDILKPPFKIPGDRYGSRQPWYFQESR